MSIWIPVIVAIITLIGTIWTVSSGNKKTLAALDKQSSETDLKLEAKLNEFKAVTETKIDALTRKVDEHNKLIDRMYKVEADVQELKHNAERN